MTLPFPVPVQGVAVGPPLLLGVASKSLPVLLRVSLLGPPVLASVMLRLLRVVLGALTSPLKTVRLTCNTPASRSTSRHCNPSSSPLLMPVVTAKM
jgi:hypothetical protein